MRYWHETNQYLVSKQGRKQITRIVTCSLSSRRRVKTYSVVGFIVNVWRLNLVFSKWIYITNIMAGKDYVNLFYLTYDAINAIKKKDLVDYIEKMKGKVVADNQIQNLCNEIANLSDNVKSLVSTNERLTSELSIIKNVNNV